MTILWRYVARLYLINIVTLIVILSLFIVTVDVVVNLDRFADRATEIAREAGGEPGAMRLTLLTLLGVIDLWGPRLLQLFVYLNGLVLIAGLGFTCTQLLAHREFVAMLAGGVSLRRAARPFIAIAAIMLGLQVAVQELWIPRIAYLLPRDQGDSGKRRLDAFPVRLAPDSKGRLWYAAQFDDATNTMHNLTVWERSGAATLTRVITADAARWDGSSWVLDHGISRVTTPEGGSVASRPQPVARLTTELDPTYLKARYLKGFAQHLSWRQLGTLLHGGAVDPLERQRLERIRWGRIASLATNFLTLIAVIPLFMLRMPQPMLLPSLRSAPIGLAGFAASAASAAVTVPGLPVPVGAFLPTAVMLSLAIAMYTGLRT